MTSSSEILSRRTRGVNARNKDYQQQSGLRERRGDTLLEDLECPIDPVGVQCALAGHLFGHITI
jgi:hypothetical protein